MLIQTIDQITGIFFVFIQAFKLQLNILSEQMGLSLTKYGYWFWHL